MPDIAVAVGAYSSYRPAARDWDELDGDPVAATRLVDATIIEWQGDRVLTVHCSLRRHGWGYGAVASAVVAALWPPALLTGAIAGGVGDRVLAWFSSGLSAEANAQLGGVMRQGPVDVVVVSLDPEMMRIVRTLERHSLASTVVSLPGSPDALLAAARDDAVGAFEA
jgi:hypothetical protein